MKHPSHQQEFDCTYDQNQPDRLLCVAHAPGMVQKRRKKGIALLFHRRYHAYYHPKHPRFFLHRTVDISLTAITIALIGFIVYLQFSGPISFTPFRISIAAEKNEFLSGEKAAFTLTVKNTGKYAITDPFLNISLPPHFTLLEPKQQNVSASRTQIPIDSTLRAREARTIVLTGIIFGEIGQRQRLSFSIQGINFRKEFIQSEMVSIEYTIMDSSVGVAVDIPPSLIAGTEFEGALRISNRSSIPISGVSVTIDTPEEFSVTFEYPFSKHSSIERIPPHQSTVIPFRAKVLAMPKRDKEMNIIVLVLADGDLIIQRQTSIPLTFEEPALYVSISPVNKQQSFVPGTRSPMVMKWKNNALETLTDVQIGVSAKGFGLDSASLLSKTAIQRKEFQLLWTKNQITDLKSIEPNTIGQLEFDIIPSTTHDVARFDSDASLESFLYPFSIYSLQGKRIQATSETYAYTIDTIASVHAVVRYYSPEGDQIGRGPLPFKVGTSTSFYAFFDVSSSIHSLEQASMTALLSSDCLPDQHMPISSGELSYNAKTGILVWTIDMLPSQFAQPNRQTGMAINITCTPSRKLQDSMPLFSNISLSGTDFITKKMIRVQAADILQKNLIKK